METISGHLYDYPVYYDLVFGSDWQSEYDFLLACFEQYAEGAVHSIFEPACGTGRLLYRLGKAGYEVSGLDINDKAIEYCNQRLDRHGLPTSAFVADMCDFQLEQPADSAFIMINSFRHLVLDRHAVAHLKAMGRAVRSGGLYILGIHLTPTVGHGLEEESWSARRGHLVVNTHMQTTAIDLEQREERFEMRYDVYTPTRQFRICDEIVFRTYTSAQFDRLLKRSGCWEVAALYDFCYDLDRPIKIGPETEDVVYVLKRT